MQTDRGRQQWHLLGLVYYEEGKYGTAEEHVPDYLRVSQAERERAEREKAKDQEAAQ